MRGCGVEDKAVNEGRGVERHQGVLVLPETRKNPRSTVVSFLRARHRWLGCKHSPTGVWVQGELPGVLLTTHPTTMVGLYAAQHVVLRPPGVNI